MRVVLDTVSLQSLLRSPEITEKGIATPLDDPIRRRELCLVVDRAGGLVDEWKKTCGEEPVKAAIAQWEPYGGVDPIQAESSIPRSESRALAQLGFKDTIDKLAVRLALATEQRTIVSDDGDFWDPDPGKKGDPKGAIATILTNRLGIELLLLLGLVKKLENA